MALKRKNTVSATTRSFPVTTTPVTKGRGTARTFRPKATLPTEVFEDPLTGSESTKEKTDDHCAEAQDGPRSTVGARSIGFSKVLQMEHEDVMHRRAEGSGNQEWSGGTDVPGRLQEDERVRQVRRPAFDNGLIGLALSGGGIRSATICLGVIQALAEVGLLRRLDYLSTVSGGGCIGSWLAAWIKREDEVECRAAAAAESSEASSGEALERRNQTGVG